ncbi:MAG: shikimate dehydrogenase [Halieaceae bacterium]|nr:shikimate dehydrogenase [Halieaceae bacterium]
MTQVDRYAVFGNPVRHSKSPWIHAAFAAQTDQQLQYRAVLVEEGGFAAAADAFFGAGGLGLNVTVPFKTDACDYANELTPRAHVAGAVNTLARRDDGSILGDNTDGVGLVRDMVANLGWQIRGRQVAILGAGGAVRGVLEPLLREQPASLLIVNRTADKALSLAGEFARLGALEAGGYPLLEGRQFDLVINGTSASLAGELPDLPDGLLNEKSCCYDMMYAPEPTAFMRWAAQHTAWAVSDGLGMLVEQAAESFYLWRGERPQTGPVLAELRNVIAGGNE